MAKLKIKMEVQAAHLPFFLQLVSYDEQATDKRSLEFARLMPHKVILGVEEFSKPQYRVDVLIVEPPFNQASLEEYDINQSCGSLLQQVEMEQVLACVEKDEIGYNGIYCQNNQNPARLAKHLKKAQAWEERLVISR